MLVIRVPGVSTTALRAKVSHTWLDHEVAMVMDADVVNRRKAGQWNAIQLRWVTLPELALEFGRAFDEFSAASLVDALSPFQSMPLADRELLKSRLDAMHREVISPVELQEEYFDKLEFFWTTAQRFFAMAADSAAADTAVLLAWNEVRGAGAELKRMFSEHRIPDGVILP